jgi:hypothetical protein
LFIGLLLLTPAKPDVPADCEKTPSQCPHALPATKAMLDQTSKHRKAH